MLQFEIGKPLPTHSSYATARLDRDFWRRAYWGTRDFITGKDASGTFLALPMHEREKEENYKRRLGQAMVRRYARSIIDRYTDYANRGDVKRPKAEPGSPYAAIQKDATGSGVSLPKLMRQSMRWAQIEQCSYLLADSNVEGVFLSAAAEASAGKRGIIRLVRADQVIWWNDWQQQVDQALIAFRDRSGAAFAWYVTPEFTQRIDYQAGASETKVLAIGPVTPHTYGGCPLVRNAPDWDDELMNPSDSQCAPIAESQKRIMNIDSWLMEELQSATFTVPVFLGATAEQVSDVVVGPGKALVVPSNGTTTPALGKLGADPAQAASHRESLAFEIRELYRCAGLTPGNPTEVGNPESGVAKAFQFNEVEAKLSALADSDEAAENMAMRRLSAGSGIAYPGDADWPEEFDTPELAAELEYVIRVDTSTLPSVMKAAAIQDFADTAFKNFTPEQKAQLATELQAKAKADAARVEATANGADSEAGSSVFTK